MRDAAAAVIRTLMGDKAAMTRREETLRDDLAQCSNFSTSITLSFLPQKERT